MGAQLDVTISPSNGQGAAYVGTITSLVETSAPEPASLLVFGILGAGLWRRHRRAVGAIEGPGSNESGSLNLEMPGSRICGCPSKQPRSRVAASSIMRRSRRCWPMPTGSAPARAVARQLVSRPGLPAPRHRLQRIDRRNHDDFPWPLRLMARIFKKKLIAGRCRRASSLPAAARESHDARTRLHRGGAGRAPPRPSSACDERRTAPAPDVRRYQQGRMGQDPPQSREPSYEFPQSRSLDPR